MKKLFALSGLLFMLAACAPAAASSGTPAMAPAASPAVTAIIDIVEPEATSTAAPPVPSVTPFHPIPIDPERPQKRTPLPSPTRFIPTPFPSPTRPAVRETHVPILMYHHIAVAPAGSDAIRYDLSVWPEHFEGHLAALAGLGFHTVKLADVYDSVTNGTPLPANPIVLTFDDGYDDVYTNALPLLQKYNFTGTFYIATGLLERPGYMTWGQVLELAKAGMDIESHSVSHPSLRNKPVDFLRREVGDSKHALETMLGHPILFFCYPSGEYDALTIAILQETGYLSATTTWGGAWQNEALPFEWPRVRIHGGDQAPTMLSRLNLYLAKSSYSLPPAATTSLPGTASPLPSASGTPGTPSPVPSASGTPLRLTPVSSPTR